MRRLAQALTFYGGFGQYLHHYWFKNHWLLKQIFAHPIVVKENRVFVEPVLSETVLSNAPMNIVGQRQEWHSLNYLEQQRKPHWTRTQITLHHLFNVFWANLVSASLVNSSYEHCRREAWRPTASTTSMPRPLDIIYIYIYIYSILLWCMMLILIKFLSLEILCIFWSFMHLGSVWFSIDARLYCIIVVWYITLWYTIC